MPEEMPKANNFGHFRIGSYDLDPHRVACILHGQGKSQQNRERTTYTTF